MEENFAHFLETNARRLGDKAALVWDDGALTWSELERRASGFARHLAEQSVGPGDRVAILIPNRWSFVVALLGALKVGATAAPLSPELRREELGELLADLRPKCVIDDVQIEEGSWVTPTHATVPAVIVYTSGSTGRPKGAVFSHEAVLFGTRLWGKVVMDLSDEDVVLGVLPYSHNYGMYAGLLAPLLFGGTAVLLEHFTPEAVFAAIKKHRVTIFPGVATMFHRLLASPLFSNSDLSSLRVATSGAAPCSPALCGDWHENTGVRILCGYGATEVPRTISYTAEDVDELPGAAGRLMPGVEIKVVDEEGRPLPDGEVGELWIKSPSAMDGYLDHPDETREVLSDGWYRSGDLGAVLPGGFVRLVGRKRDRILRGGYSVFPQEVEAVLISHPAVAEAAVAGVLDADLGEEIAAFITLKASAEATEEEIIAYCKERLAHYKYPRKVTILNELPRGEMGKVLKSELLKRYTGD
jgi:long-chain acyl-CoA synthetase